MNRINWSKFAAAVFLVPWLTLILWISVPMCFSIVLLAFGAKNIDLIDIIPSIVFWISAVLILGLYYWYKNRNLESSELRKILISYVYGSLVTFIFFYFIVRTIILLPNPNPSF
jgi:hypothetical protein